MLPRSKSGTSYQDAIAFVFHLSKLLGGRDRQSWAPPLRKIGKSNDRKLMQIEIRLLPNGLYCMQMRLKTIIRLEKIRHR